MVWNFEIFRGDGALYAFCPECGFHYTAGVGDEITKYYNYCPICGTYLYDENEELYITWKERFIFDEDVMKEMFGKE